ncbi:MAG: double-strand break repair helicase AddA [Alphaproteobacteria bacterium]
MTRSPRIPLPDTGDADANQRRAADPKVSVWVAASAGTGKTKVLTDRVLALLIAGTPPSRLLCLTYTRAAAAEMAIRVQRELGKFAVMDDGALAQAIAALGLGAGEPEKLDRARRLFADVLDCPGGLKIQTIHAFCESLLRRFPVEAGLAPHFQVLDETEQKALLAGARDEVLARAVGAGPAGTEDALARAVDRVAGRLSAEAFDGLLQDLTTERGRIARLLALEGGLDGAVAAIARRLGVGPTLTEADVIAAACAEGAFDAAGLRAAAVVMENGGKRDKERADRIVPWLAADDATRAALYETYLRGYFTKEGDPFDAFISKGALKAVQRPDDLLAAMAAEAARLLAVEDRRRAVRTAQGSIAALTIGAALIDAYGARKAARARLDYDDLILHTRSLLSSRESTQWVLYKLDGGIDHVLVDEAQDTSPDQWEVVRRLTGEFFAGLGRRAERDDTVRTMFAVGDAKQSIYSFQRADPRFFADMRDAYRGEVTVAGGEFRDVGLHHSFRSTAPVLAAVDGVFARPPARDGLAVTEDGIAHVTRREGQGGTVELWPAVEPLDEAPPDPWAPLPDAEAGGSAEARLARLIAVQIKEWIGTLDLPARGRKLQAGDVLVLVRRRTHLVDKLVRAFKRLDVGVTGVDRMKLAGELAVMDLVALARFLILPEDDYSLACVLKGPFCDLNDDDLLALAPGRKGSLWAELNAQAGKHARWLAVRDTLAALLARTDYLRPFELFAAMLDENDGRARLIARLGAEAEDPVNEFLELALSFERGRAPSLQAFLAWFEGGQSDIKRDLEQASRDEVRIMTVHGAKGLQAPVVILPDTMSMPRRVDPPYWCESGLGADMPLWTPRTADLDPVARQLRAEAERARDEEYHRLLYVAMTRAEDMLFVTGWKGHNRPPAGCWYNLVRDGLAAAPGVETVSFTDPLTGSVGDGLRLAAPQAPDARLHESDAERTLPRDDGAVTLDGWERLPPRAEATARPVTPSTVIDADAAAEPAVLSPLSGDAAARFRKGRLVHGLLELLPGVPPARRSAAAERFLARPSLGLTPELRREIADETLALLDDPAFGALFGPDSLAEVPLTGILGGNVVSGQIDRLVVGDSEVRIVDYKTARPVPDDASRVAPAYVTQMAFYRATLAAIFPGRGIRCALLYTAAPKFVELPDPVLDAALPTAGGK